MPARLKPVTAARMRVQRADGTREVVYSAEAVPVRQFRRWLKLKRHLRFMAAEDRRDGWV